MVKVRFRVEIAIVLDLRYIWNNFRLQEEIVIILGLKHIWIILGFK